jgi:hypothetical protein
MVADMGQGLVLKELILEVRYRLHCCVPLNKV